MTVDAPVAKILEDYGDRVQYSVFELLWMVLSAWRVCAAVFSRPSIPRRTVCASISSAPHAAPAQKSWAWVSLRRIHMPTWSDMAGYHSNASPQSVGECRLRVWCEAGQRRWRLARIMWEPIVPACREFSHRLPSTARPERVLFSDQRRLAKRACSTAMDSQERGVP